MSSEVRTMREGELWWVQASGAGTAWSTASAPASGLFGFVDSMDYTSAQQASVMYDRGTPKHHKVTQKDAIQVNVTFRMTGHVPTALSGSGASVPLFHLEHKMDVPEDSSTTGRYHQFHGVNVNQHQFTENAEGNTVGFTTVALGMNGPTGSGYVK